MLVPARLGTWLCSVFLSHKSVLCSISPQHRHPQAGPPVPGPRRFLPSQPAPPAARLIEHNSVLWPRKRRALSRRLPQTPRPAVAAPALPGILHAIRPTSRFDQNGAVGEDQTPRCYVDDGALKRRAPQRATPQHQKATRRTPVKSVRRSIRLRCARRCWWRARGGKPESRQTPFSPSLRSLPDAGPPSVTIL